MHTIKLANFAIHICVISLLLFSCNANNNNGKGKDKEREEIDFKSLPHSSDMYDFNNPKVIDLPIALDEISGIAYYPPDTSIFAIIDEDAILYKIPIKSPKKLKQWIFGEPGDYEDVVLKDSTFYVLKSNGKVYELHFNGGEVRTVEHDFLTGSKKENEFETLYIDSVNKQLHIVCKNCEEDNKSRVTAFRMVDSTKTWKDDRIISTSEIAQALKQDRIKLRPSAGGVNPITKELYLISSVAKTIAVFDTANNFVAAYALDKKIYKQPEGLTFTPEGHLLISNEFAEKGVPNLLIIKNKKAK